MYFNKKKPNSFEKLRTNLEKVVKQTEEIKLKDFDSIIKIVFFLKVFKKIFLDANIKSKDNSPSDRPITNLKISRIMHCKLKKKRIII